MDRRYRIIALQHQEAAQQEPSYRGAADLVLEITKAKLQGVVVLPASLVVLVLL
jgi:hypothetical protein